MPQWLCLAQHLPSLEAYLVHERTNNVVKPAVTSTYGSRVFGTETSLQKLEGRIDYKILSSESHPVLWKTLASSWHPTRGSFFLCLCVCVCVCVCMGRPGGGSGELFCCWHILHRRPQLVIEKRVVHRTGCHSHQRFVKSLVQEQ